MIVKSPFIQKNSGKIPSYPIGRLLRRKVTTGDIGLEIEVEGFRLPKAPFDLSSKYWVYHEDGSLRGEDNAEYVLAKPVFFSEVNTALDELWESFRRHESRLDDSNRTSVHVHLNVQKFHLNRLAAFTALYFAVEEVLTQWCGDHRVGNLFCLRAKDAPGLITRIKKFIQSAGDYSIPDGLHYAGLNIQALQKFGSVEIRTLRGCDKEVILTWVQILQRIYELSDEFKDPRDVCSMFSCEGPRSFYEKVLGDNAHKVMSEAGFSDFSLRESLYEGIRMAQDICYCRDWDLLEIIETKEDPFGREVPSAPTGGINWEVLNTSTPTASLQGHDWPFAIPGLEQSIGLGETGNIDTPTPNQSMTDSALAAFFEGLGEPEYDEDDE